MEKQTRAQMLKERRDKMRKIYRHIDRVRDLPKLRPGEAESLIAKHIAEHGVTKLEHAYAAETEREFAHRRRAMAVKAW